jgi:hypothetical protein
MSPSPTLRRTAQATNWAATIPPEPDDLHDLDAGAWTALAMAFANPTWPDQLGGADVLRTAAPWRNRVVLRHGGCGGVVGTILDRHGLVVLGVLDHDQLYRQFEIVRITTPLPDYHRLVAATTTLDHGICRKCSEEVALGPARPTIRRLTAPLNRSTIAVPQSQTKQRTMTTHPVTNRVH